MHERWRAAYDASALDGKLPAELIPDSLDDIGV
jgi:hypothetical protein